MTRLHNPSPAERSQPASTGFGRNSTGRVPSRGASDGFLKEPRLLRKSALRLRLLASHFTDCASIRARCQRIEQRIHSVIPADAILVRIHLEDILGPRGVMLEAGQSLDEALTPLMDEKRRANAGGRVAQAAQHFGPAIDAVHAGRTERDAVFRILLGDGATIAQT